MSASAGVPISRLSDAASALSEQAVTKQAIATWDREPLFHVSSPVEGWDGAKPERHHDFIDVKDVPKCWRGLRLTVEVEAKAKEVAVLRLLKQLRERGRS